MDRRHDIHNASDGFLQRRAVAEAARQTAIEAAQRDYAILAAAERAIHDPGLLAKGVAADHKALRDKLAREIRAADVAFSLAAARGFL